MSDSRPYILVLDNGKQFSALLAKALSEFNLVVFRATDLQTAKKKIAQFRPEMVFFWEGFCSDRECFTFCEKMKEVSMLSDIPYVIVSALVSDNNRLQAKKCGADDIIPSRIEEDKLRGIVTSFMSRNS